MPNNINKRFEGFSSPNYTNVPDQFFDELLADLTGNETKVVLYIMRRTFGFKKTSDDISLSQMVDGIRTKEGTVLDRGTGLHKSSVSDALKKLESKGIVIRTRRTSSSRGYLPTSYKLRFKNDPLVRQSDKPLSNRRTRLVRDTDIQQTVIQNTVTTSSRDSKNDDEIIKILKKEGFSKGIAERFSKTYSLKEIQTQVDYLHFRLEQDPASVKNLASYLYKAIEDGFPPPPGYKSPEQLAREENQKRQETTELKKQLKAIEVAKNAGAKEARKEADERLKALRVQYGATADDHSVGLKVKSKLKSAGMNPVLLTGLDFLKLDSNVGKAYFAVEHAFALNQLKKATVLEKFRQALESTTGEIFDPEFVCIQNEIAKHSTWQ